MIQFQVFETTEFARQLAALSQSYRRVIQTKLGEQIYPHLKQSPYFGSHIRKLRDYQPETWRYRVGDYRLFYRIDNKERIVKIISVDHRKDSYR